MSIVVELRRRNVFKVGIAYLIAAWLIAQVTELALDSFAAPEWVIKTVLFLLVVGFPIALIFAWAFELTPEGIKRERESDDSETDVRHSNRKLDFVIVTVLVIALGYLAADKFLWTGSEAEELASRASIAVLPFENLSPDPANESFGEGLSEELLNLLVKIPELDVPARTSSFAFKDTDINIQEIARLLNVDYVLEGSVRKSGDTIRITAQLIKAEDGFHFWSETWDRQWSDIFVIQDEIAAAVVDNLKVKLLGGLPTVNPVDPEAYAIFVNLSGGREARLQSLARAIAIDPNFSKAWSVMALFQLNHALSQAETPEVEMAFAEAAAINALRLDATNVQAMIMMGASEWLLHWNFEEAAAWFRKARATNPSHAGAFVAAAGFAESFGLVELGLELRQEGFRKNPRERDELANLIGSTIDFGDFDTAAILLLRLEELDPNFPRLSVLRAKLAYGRGEFDTSLKLSEQLDSPEHVLRACALGRLGRDSEARTELDDYMTMDHSSAFGVAKIYSCWQEENEAFDWLDTARERREPPLMWGLRSDPDMRVLQSDPRWEVLLDQLGISDEHADTLRF